MFVPRKDEAGVSAYMHTHTHRSHSHWTHTQMQVVRCAPVLLCVRQGQLLAPPLYVDQIRTKSTQIAHALEPYMRPIRKPTRPLHKDTVSICFGGGELPKSEIERARVEET